MCDYLSAIRGDEHISAILKNWMVGIASSMGAVGITLSDLELWLRIIGAGSGVIISWITIYRLLRTKKPGKSK